jgi:hypothetical protein
MHLESSQNCRHYVNVLAYVHVHRFSTLDPEAWKLKLLHTLLTLKSRQLIFRMSTLNTRLYFISLQILHVLYCTLFTV